MVSSVVGFYSSPLFWSLRPRWHDTAMTQVAEREKGKPPGGTGGYSVLAGLLSLLLFFLFPPR
jgi:hypothetical protein